MSDLSAPFLPASALAKGTPALRGNDSSTPSDAAPRNGEGSFSSLLNDKVGKTKEPSADKSPGARPSAQEKPGESNANPAPASAGTASAPETAAAASESDSDSNAAAPAIAANSPLATMLLQLLPRTALSADATESEQDAATGAEAEALGVTVTGLTPAEIGLALATPGAHPLGPETPATKEAPAAVVPQAIAATEGAEAEGASVGLTDTAVVAASAGVEQHASFSAGSDDHDSAITAETKATLAGETRANEESSFAQLLGRAQESNGQTGVAAMRGANAAENTTHMQHAAGHPNWSNELGDKLTWMVTTQKQQAELVLNPPQLGRIEVSLTVTGDQANAVFASPNAAVREMIENSLPRLREILAGSGLNLGQADVGAQSFSQQRGEQAADNRHGGTSRATFVDGLPGLHEVGLSTGSMSLGRAGERQGMVDIFA